MNTNIRINRNKSMNYFRSLIYCIKEANRLHLNNNITHNFNRVDGKEHKWFHHIVVEGVCGREFEVKFICEYDIPNNSEYIKLLSWEENGEIFDNFTGFRSFDNSLGANFTLAYSDCRHNARIREQQHIHAAVRDSAHDALSFCKQPVCNCHTYHNNPHVLDHARRAI